MADKVHDVWLFDAIDPFWGCSAKAVTEEITKAKEAKATNIVVHINSPGGSVFEGYAIYNALKSSGLKVTTRIEGLCASIATLIALGGDTIEMSELSNWMIHNPFSQAQGDAEELRKQADVLQKVQDQIMSAYMSRTGKTQEEITEAMQKETWLSAKEAKEWGFVDVITEPLNIAAYLNSHKMNDKNKGKIASLFSEIKSLLTASATDPKAGSMKLKDNDTVLYWEGEEIVTGSTKVFTDAEMTIPAPEGDHMLEDGRMITVSADGTVERVMGPEDTAAMDELKKENEALTAKVQELENAFATQAEAHKNQIDQVNNKLGELEKLGLGKDLKIKNTVTVPPGSPKPKPQPGSDSTLLTQFKQRFNRTRTL